MVKSSIVIGLLLTVGCDRTQAASPQEVTLEGVDIFFPGTPKPFSSGEENGFVYRTDGFEMSAVAVRKGAISDNQAAEKNVEAALIAKYPGVVLKDNSHAVIHPERHVAWKIDEADTGWVTTVVVFSTKQTTLAERVFGKEFR